MPKKKKAGETVPAELKTADYRHAAEKRTNIPPARMAGEGHVPAVPKARYAYSPHLPPTLQFDPTGEPDRLNEMLEKASRQALTEAEVTRLRGALRVHEPTLEWAGKREQHEKGFLEVDPVALHIHERISARAIVRAALREDVQRDLFADPQQPYQQAVQFYKHNVDWANRLILGDSLQVMSSLAKRENLASRVQMIYIDPPYGVQFRSNFQPLTNERSVGTGDEDITREPEMVRAYRDTWHHGVHSYLEYLRQRFLVARELLADTGSVFVQISDDNAHLVRQVLDEVFTPRGFVSQIAFTKGPGGLETKEALAARFDYLLWYCKNPEATTTFKLYTSDEVDSSKFGWFETPDGQVGRLSSINPGELPEGSRLFADESLTKPGPGSKYEFPFQGKTYNSGRRWWGTPEEALRRALRANRAFVVGNTIRRKKYLDESPPKLLDNLWADLGGAYDPVYVVQTNAEVIKRCMLMTTQPGDLVLDPTCGSGTTAYVAEQFGRRWITIDTSRVALFLARQRLLTSRFDCYEVVKGGNQPSVDPSVGFVYRKTRNVTFSDVSQNTSLDQVLDKWDGALDAALEECNAMWQRMSLDERKSVSTVDAFEHWTLPKDARLVESVELQAAVANYCSLWRQKLSEVNALIEASIVGIDLRDRPMIRRGVVRVCGPFTVEGVRPEELSFGEDGLFDGTPNEFDSEDNDDAISIAAVGQNLHAYLDQMVRFLRGDGVTFLDNKRRTFIRLEPLYEQGTGGALHAEGVWADAADPEDTNVAVAFGPQYGPVTASQVEDLVRASRRYDELVIAGFSFDADATALIQEQSNPRLRIHQAYIRPDVNPGMAGLLKETPNSQLFTVFGTPEVTVTRVAGSDEWTVALKGVDVYDPVRNEVRSTGADKVAAWFLDSDFDGRCFCVTQAFFPNQDAWDKIAKSLGSAADAEAFEAFKGTVSVPFPIGTHKRIAVKVIDPRGNEVMAVRVLED